MLLHWMHTRCRTGLVTGADLGEALGAGEPVLVATVSLVMARFYHGNTAPPRRVTASPR